MSVHRIFFPLTLIAACTLAQQPAAPSAERVTGSNPIDPLALQVLKATTDTLKNAKVFSFRAVIQRETLGSNDQMVTSVRRNDVTISRPNRVRMNVTSEQQTAEVYYNNGELFIYSPKEKMYMGLGTASLNLDTMVDRLEANGIVLPMSPFFRSDAYRTLIDGLQSASVIGRDEIDGKPYHHLMFTKADTETQLWVEGGTAPLPRRAQVIYKTLPRQPRMIVDYSDWNMNPNFANDYFQFKRPPDAKPAPVIDPNEIKEKLQNQQ